MSAILLHLLTALSYGLLGYYFWETRWSEGNHFATRVFSARLTWERYLLLPPLALHGWLLYQSVVVGVGLDLGVGNAISLIAWMTVALYWIVSFFYPFEGLQTFVAPMAAVCSLLPLAFASPHPLADTELLAFKTHLAMAMLAYALFTIAALHGILMTLVERRLHSHALAATPPELPPLLTMERLLFRIIIVAFVLLTLTLLSGIVFSEARFGRPLVFNHKTVFAFLSWGMFAALLLGRRFYGWRGRVAVRWVWGGFVALLLAYIGTKFALEVILQRA
jgi:ABC-type uncharacterized transport system permease subunit